MRFWTYNRYEIMSRRVEVSNPEGSKLRHAWEIPRAERDVWREQQSTDRGQGAAPMRLPAWRPNGDADALNEYLKYVAAVDPDLLEYFPPEDSVG